MTGQFSDVSARTNRRVGSLYSVVVPVYRNAESLPEVVAALEWLQQNIDADVEGVFVVDGSPDESARVLQEILPCSTVQSQLICHSRNFGAFAAIRTGFLAARGDFVAAMAADLQEPIELMVEFHDRLTTGEADIAVGTRAGRHDPAASRALSSAYWRVYRRVVEPQMPPGGVDIFACTRQVAQCFHELTESHSSLIGQLYWLGYRRVEVPYTRQERRHGTSAWTFRKKLRYLLDSVFSFTSLPISIILAVGLAGTCLAMLGAFVVFVAWLTGHIVVPGYTALMLVLLMATGSILSALGIVGTYVWRAYENTKNRPGSVVMRREEYAPSAQSSAADVAAAAPGPPVRRERSQP
jgi:hypothetical protein